MILGKGHDTAVDYWSLGVLLYELCAGYGPFAGDENTPPIDIYRRILECHITFPPHFSRSLQDLTKKLLEPAAFKRLGNTVGYLILTTTHICLSLTCTISFFQANGADGVKGHRFFENYPWNELLERKLTPPVIPVVKSKFDTSNFDDVPDVSLTEVPPVSDWNPSF